MRVFSTEAKVGVVVLAALSALVWLTFQIGEFRFREKGYLIEAVFRTVSGLEDKAKVRMAGVLVGSVDRIFLKDGMAHALLRLDDGIVVRRDSVVAVASIGILSERYVEITAGSPDAPVVPAGSVVTGRELTDLDQLIAQMAETSGSIKVLADTITANFGGADSTLSLLLKNTNGLVDRVNALLDDNRRQIGQLIGQSAALARETNALLADNREELRGTIVNLREFSATLNRRADEISREVTATTGELRTQIARTGDEVRATLKGGREDVQGLLDSLRSASGKAEAAADALTSVLRKVDGGTGTIGRLVNDPATVDKVDNAVDQIGGIAGKINAGQGSLGRLVTDDQLIVKLESAADSANRMLGEADRINLFLGYRGEYLPDANGLKSYVTVKFKPRADKYYLLELVDDPAGKRSITNTSTTIEQPEGSYVLNERTVVYDQSELKFSVLFAKEFGALTLRGGLLESQGGAGLDYEILRDRASLSLDAWDFGREEGAHYKFTGKLRLYKDFFVSAGVDDFGEEERRSAFLGAGILFSDEDLKYVLSLGKYVQ